MAGRDLSWQDFLDRLTKSLLHDGTLSSSFKGLKSDKERSKFIRTHSSISMQIADWLATHLHGNESSNFQKNRTVMLQLKSEGNKAFVGKNDEKAIEMYNSALLCAPKTDSALLYGNRSAVFFSQGLWRKCITDIEVAIKLRFPEERLWKLYQRKGETLAKIGRFEKSNEHLHKALKLLKGSEDPEVHVARIERLMAENKKHVVETLPVEENLKSSKEERVESIIPTPFQGWSDNITYGSSCLAIHHDSEQGRYVVANRDIPSGSVIISEKPYAGVLLSPWYKTHCTHCFMPVSILFACHKCSQIVYCSEACREASWDEYHNFECQKLELLETIGIARLALRIYLVTLKEDLRKHEDTPALSRTTGCDAKGVYRGDYESVFYLLTHSDKMVVEDLFQYSAAGVLLLKILMMQQQEQIEQDYDHVGSLLIRHILQLVCNAHAITSLNDTPLINQNSSIIEQDQVRIATAIYPTTSLLNHSCEPTIVNCFQKDTLVVKTVRHVKTGEQIYNCYGPHFRRMDFMKRQNSLKNQYFFDCRCSHCLKGISVDSLLNNYRCDKCNSSMSDHSVDDKKCVGDLTKRIAYCKEKQDSCQSNFKVGLEMLGKSEENAKNTRHALQIFCTCAKTQEQVLSKYHRELSETYDVIAKCYALLGDYEQCISFVSKSITVTEKHFGNDSVEVTNELLKLSDLYMAAMQLFIDSKQSRDKIRKHLPGACQVLERTISLVDKNKEPGCEDMVLLQNRLESLVKLKYMSSR